MAVPLSEKVRIGTYILTQKLKGNRRYPLVLMLEPLFRCNLACPGCGKIDYPKEILDMRLSVEDCLSAADECGAPVVSIPGGEPLLHKEIDQIVSGLIARRKYVIVCTNALLLEKKLDLFKPSKYLAFSVHLDGDRDHHDKAVDQKGVYDRAVKAIRTVRDRGFRVRINSTLFESNANDPDNVAAFFDEAMAMGVEGITVSPGYAYERAPDQQHFLSRRRTKELFREIFRRGKEKGRRWQFTQSSMFLDFLAGNQSYECTPWGLPTRNVFGWQRPCYLLGEGYAASYRELMDTTDWDSYGTGKYAKCANCMVHCGYEPTAVNETFRRPWKALQVALTGIRTDGAFAEDVPLDKARPAEWVHDQNVARFLADLHARRQKAAAE